MQYRIRNDGPRFMRLPHPPFRAADQGLRALALCLACLASAPAAAQQDLSQDDWSFNLFNDSTMPVAAFQIEDKNGIFGYNWLAEPMAPGTGLTLEFNDPLDKRCEIQTRIVFQNGALLDGYIDYCGTAIVQVTNDGLFFE